MAASKQKFTGPQTAFGLLKIIAVYGTIGVFGGWALAGIVFAVALTGDICIALAGPPSE